MESSSELARTPRGVDPTQRVATAGRLATSARRMGFLGRRTG